MKCVRIYLIWMFVAQSMVLIRVIQMLLSFLHFKLPTAILEFRCFSNHQNKHNVHRIANIQYSHAVHVFHTSVKLSVVILPKFEKILSTTVKLSAFVRKSGSF